MINLEPNVPPPGEPPEIVQLKADLWLEVVEHFKRNDIWPHGASVHVLPGKTIEDMLISITALFYTKEVYTTEEAVSIPDGWWQTYKEECWPKWLRRLFPVKRKQLTCTKQYYRIAPYLKLPPSESRKAYMDFLTSPQKPE